MHATILLAHGSRDPSWSAPLLQVAQRMRELQPHTHVCCAYLELCPPDLGSVVEELIAQQVSQIRILPMFLGLGKHAREDLPVLVGTLRQRHPSLQIELRPSIGEDPRLIHALAQLALDRLPACP